jgi:outer membrane protein assembly factor BamB
MLALALTVTASAVSAHEWTRFRGPNGSGESDAPNIPAKWTEKDYNWRVSLPGKGHSAPVLWENKLFITSGDPKTAEQIVQCFDAKAGKPLWEKRFESKPHTLHAFNTYASSTPCVDGERVYVSWSHPEALMMVALDHSGEEKWRANLGPVIGQHGHGASPIVHGELVVMANDQGDEEHNGKSFLIALDRCTGDEKWRVPRKTREMAYSTPCVYKPAKSPDQLIFNSGAEGMTSIEPASGKINWTIELFDKRSCSSPVIAGGMIFGSCGSGAGGGNYVVAVRPPDGIDRTAPEVAYKMTKAAFAPYVPGFVARGDRIFMWSDRGFASCLNAKDGEVIWQERVGGNFFGSPIRVGDRIYCIEQKGEMVVIRAGDKYELLARNPLGEPSNSTPAVAGGVMYIRTQSHLMSLGGRPSESGR